MISEEVEAAVLKYVWSAIEDAGYLVMIEKNVRDMRNVKSMNSAREKRAMKVQLGNIQMRIDGLLLMQGQTTSAAALKLAMQKFESLSKEKSDLEASLARLSQGIDQAEVISASVSLVQSNLRDFQRGFVKAKGSMKKRLIRKLLKQVVITADGIHIFMQLADGVEIPNHQIKLLRFEEPESGAVSPFVTTKKAFGSDSNLEVLGSDNDKVGDSSRNRTCNPRLRRTVLYPVELWSQEKWTSWSYRKDGGAATARTIKMTFNFDLRSWNAREEAYFRRKGVSPRGVIDIKVPLRKFKSVYKCMISFSTDGLMRTDALRLFGGSSA